MHNDVVASYATIAAYHRTFAHHMNALSTPLFSVIVPVYSYARYLPRALDSILAQRGEDYEIIVVDDGSTDHTAEVVRGYQARTKQNMTYAFQANRGPAAARNHGARLSTGQYLWFLDADDELLPDAFDRCRSIIGKDHSLDFIWGGRMYVTVDGKVKYRPAKSLSPQKEQNFIRYVRRALGRISTGTVVVHRRVFDCIRFPEAIRIGEDAVFHAHLLALYNGVSFHDPIVKIFLHSDSLGHDAKVRKQERLTAFKLLFDPTILPAKLMPLRDEVFSLGCMAQFLSFYRAGLYKDARHFYHQAIRAFPRHLGKFKYLRKYLRTLFHIRR